MKITQTIIITKELHITGATLPTIRQAQKIPTNIRVYKEWYWSQTKGHWGNYVACINEDGSFFHFGNVVNDYTCLVRPVLTIKDLQYTDLKIGDIFTFGRKKFQIITNTLAFCLDDIGNCEFRADWTKEEANDYNTSDVKKYINDWFNRAKRG